MSPNGFLEIWTMDPSPPLKVHLSDQFHSLSTPTRNGLEFDHCSGFVLGVGQFIEVGGWRTIHKKT
jgi:hypothetical protein